MASTSAKPSDTAIRIALGYEVLANIPTIFLMLAYPDWVVDYLRFTPPPSLLGSKVTESVLTPTLEQWIACLFVGFTIAVGSSIGRSPRAVHSRATLYAGLLVTDAMLVGLMLWHAFVVGEENVGVKKTVLLNGAASLVPYVLWRGWVLGWKGEWVGLRDRRVKAD
jgi:hypothetical protein